MFVVTGGFLSIFSWLNGFLHKWQRYHVFPQRSCVQITLELTSSALQCKNHDVYFHFFFMDHKLGGIRGDGLVSVSHIVDFSPLSEPFAEHQV